MLGERLMPMGIPHVVALRVGVARQPSAPSVLAFQASFPYAILSGLRIARRTSAVFGSLTRLLLLLLRAAAQRLSLESHTQAPRKLQPFCSGPPEPRIEPPMDRCYVNSLVRRWNTELVEEVFLKWKTEWEAEQLCFHVWPRWYLERKLRRRAFLVWKVHGQTNAGGNDPARVQTAAPAPSK